MVPRRLQRIIRHVAMMSPCKKETIVMSKLASALPTEAQTNPVTPSPKTPKRKVTSIVTPAVSPTLCETTSRKRKSSSNASMNQTASQSTLSSLLTTDMVASINPTQPFLDLHASPQELRASATLTTGQCFHWQVVHPSSPTPSIHSSLNVDKKVSAWGTHDAKEFVGTLRLNDKESVVLVIRETPTTTLYRPLTTLHSFTPQELHQRLREYFQLDQALLRPLYQEWSQACPRLATIAKCIPGVRILDQDPWECLVSFLCSSNNNIPRITKILNALRREYGRPLLAIPVRIGDSDQQTGQHHAFFSFPTLEDLYSQANDADLRNKCGMGYRAKYLLETMKFLQEKGGEAYLKDEVRSLSDPVEVQTKLCEFCGVGRKVADCVALFSLQQHSAIPVDIHVWNIALRDYDTPEAALCKMQSLTPSNYQKVGDVFRQRFPNRAGWAHSLLFVAELPSFREILPKQVIQEMEEFRQQEQKKKQRKN